jgi:hypothetical protein
MGPDLYPVNKGEYVLQTPPDGLKFVLADGPRDVVPAGELDPVQTLRSDRADHIALRPHVPAPLVDRILGQLVVVRLNRIWFGAAKRHNPEQSPPGEVATRDYDDGTRLHHFRGDVAVEVAHQDSAGFGVERDRHVLFETAKRPICAPRLSETPKIPFKSIAYWWRRGESNPISHAPEIPLHSERETYSPADPPLFPSVSSHFRPKNSFTFANSRERSMRSIHRA